MNAIEQTPFVDHALARFQSTAIAFVASHNATQSMPFATPTELGVYIYSAYVGPDGLLHVERSFASTYSDVRLCLGY